MGDPRWTKKQAKSVTSLKYVSSGQAALTVPPQNPKSHLQQRATKRIFHRWLLRTTPHKTAEVDSEGEERLTTTRQALKSNHMEKIGSVPPPVPNLSDVAPHHDPQAHAKPTQAHRSPRSENKEVEMHTNTRQNSTRCTAKRVHSS